VGASNKSRSGALEARHWCLGNGICVPNGIDLAALSAGAIIGIAVGAAAFLVSVFAIAYCCCCRKKKKDAQVVYVVSQQPNKAA
jgi:hypothetical protein